MQFPILTTMSHGMTFDNMKQMVGNWLAESNKMKITLIIPHIYAGVALA